MESKIDMYRENGTLGKFSRRKRMKYVHKIYVERECA